MKYGLGGIVNGAGSYGGGGADGTQFVIDRKNNSLTLLEQTSQFFEWIRLCIGSLAAP
jgi:hypothetical protein